MKRFIAVLIAVVLTIGMTSSALASYPGGASASRSPRTLTPRRGNSASSESASSSSGSSGRESSSSEASSQAEGDTSGASSVPTTPIQPATPSMSLLSGTPSALEAGATVTLQVPGTGTNKPVITGATLGGTLSSVFNTPVVVSGENAVTITLTVKSTAAAGSYTGTVTASTAGGTHSVYSMTATVKAEEASQPETSQPGQSSSSSSSQSESSAGSSSSSSSGSGSNSNGNNGSNSAGSSQPSQPESSKADNGNSQGGDGNADNNTGNETTQPTTVFVAGASSLISGTIVVDDSNSSVRVTVGGDAYSDGNARRLSTSVARSGYVRVRLSGPDASKFNLTTDNSSGNVAVITPKSGTANGNYTVYVELQSGGETVQGTVNIGVNRTQKEEQTGDNTGGNSGGEDQSASGSSSSASEPDSSSSPGGNQSGSEPESGSGLQPGGEESSQSSGSSQEEITSSQEPSSDSSEEEPPQEPEEPKTIKLEEGATIQSGGGDGSKYLTSGMTLATYPLDSSKFENAGSNSDITQSLINSLDVWMTVDGGSPVRAENTGYFQVDRNGATAGRAASIELTVADLRSEATLDNVIIYLTMPDPDDGSPIASGTADYSKLVLSGAPGGTAGADGSLIAPMSALAVGDILGLMNDRNDRISISPISNTIYNENSEYFVLLTLSYQLFYGNDGSPNNEALNGQDNDHQIVNDLWTSNRLSVTLDGDNAKYFTLEWVPATATSAAQIKVVVNGANLPAGGPVPIDSLDVVVTLAGVTPPNNGEYKQSFTGLGATLGLSTLYDAPASGSKIDGLNDSFTLEDFPGLYYLNGVQVANFEGIDFQPDDELKLYLVGGMFSWSGDAPGHLYPVTTSQLRNGKITVKRGSAKGTDLIENFDIKSDSRGSYIIIEMVEYFVSVKEKDVSVTFYISHNNKRDDSYSFLVDGSMVNDEIDLYNDDEYADLSDGVIANAEEYIRSIELHLGNGVYLTTNLTSGRSYYGVAVDSITRSDERIIENYEDVEYIITLKTVNLSSSSGRKVSFDMDDHYYVYNADGNYVGRSNESVTFSEKYYFASRRVSGIDTGSGNSGSGVVEGDGSSSSGGDGGSGGGSSGGGSTGIEGGGSSGAGGGDGSSSGVTGGNSNDNAYTGGWLLTPCNALFCAEIALEALG